MLKCTVTRVMDAPVKKEPKFFRGCTLTDWGAIYEVFFSCSVVLNIECCCLDLVLHNDDISPNLFIDSWVK